MFGDDIFKKLKHMSFYRAGDSTLKETFIFFRHSYLHGSLIKIHIVQHPVQLTVGNTCSHS